MRSTGNGSARLERVNLELAMAKKKKRTSGKLTFQA
jgi:hypothetical protein